MRVLASTILFLMPCACSESRPKQHSKRNWLDYVHWFEAMEWNLMSHYHFFTEFYSMVSNTSKSTFLLRPISNVIRNVQCVASGCLTHLHS